MNQSKTYIVTNIAVNKPTAQSSIYAPAEYDPHGACNTQKTGKFGFHTQKEEQPWWQIDLQGIYQLYLIRIYNRLELPARASQLNILFSLDAINWHLSYCHTDHQVFGGIDGNPLIVNIDQQIVRYVRLQLRDNQYLHLDEVEIYGMPASDQLTNPITVKQEESALANNFYQPASLPIPSHLMQECILQMLGKLRMHDTDLKKVRIGNLGDGGYVVPDDLENIAGVLSIGIGQEVSFDLEFAKRGIKVFQYDHTISKLPIEHENFIFQPLGWGKTNQDNLITLNQMIENHGLAGQELILKFDIEGAEWDNLVNLTPEILQQFRLIICELHWFDKLEDSNFFHKVNRVISLLTTNHTVVHIHPNNCCGVALVAGVTVPKLMEFSLLRHDRATFYPSYQSIPSSLDYPNVKSKPEIILTPFHADINLNINR